MDNEITMKLNCSIDEMERVLQNKGFQVTRKFLLDDIYFVLKSMDISKMIPREILKSCVLIRHITNYMPREYTELELTYKNKEIAENGEIIKQENINCKIDTKEDGKCFLEAIGYRELMKIKENYTVYGKNGLEIDIKDIEDGDKLIEIETVANDTELNTIEKLKKKVNSLGLPVDTNNYFVKKAEVQLEKWL